MCTDLTMGNSRLRHFKKVLFFILAGIGFLTDIQATPAMTQPTNSMPPQQAVSQQLLLNIQHWQTSQGVPVYFVNTPQLPMLDILVLFNAGASRDGNKPGIAQLTSALLDEGAGDLTADQIAQQFDNVGAIYNIAFDRDKAGVSLRTLTDPKFLQPAIQTFTKVLTAPKFADDAVQRIKNQALAALQQEQQQPGALAKKIFAQLLYGDQPYGHPILGTPESIKALQPADVAQFYRQYYVTGNATVIMVGDVSLDSAKNIAQSVTEKLTVGKPPQPLPAAKPATVAQQKTINFPAQQTTVLIGQISVTPQDPDLIPLTVGNYVLGSDPLVSQLSLQIRSQHGWAYSVLSLFSPLQAGGPFALFLQTRNEQAQNAANLARQILEQFIQQGPTDQQLADAKRNIIGSFPLGLDSNADILGQLSDMIFYHLPMDYLDTYRAKVAAVTADQVKAVFQKQIHPKDMVTVMVGNIAAAQPSTPAAPSKSSTDGQ